MRHALAGMLGAEQVARAPSGLARTLPSVFRVADLRLALECEDSEDTFVDSAEGLLPP
jgi:hypothetical protein